MDDYRLADDRDLLTAVAGGREAALGVLYDRFHRQCFSFALRMLAAEGDAEEAVQETFVRVWRSAAQYDASRASVVSWLLSITRNLCMENPAPDRTDEEAERGILGAQVRAALRSLSSEQRSAIELVYFHGLTSQEVGRLLDVPAPTVRSRLRLGLLKLGGLLQEKGLIGVD